MDLIYPQTRGTRRAHTERPNRTNELNAFGSMNDIFGTSQLPDRHTTHNNSSSLSSSSLSSLRCECIFTFLTGETCESGIWLGTYSTRTIVFSVVLPFLSVAVVFSFFFIPFFSIPLRLIQTHIQTECVVLDGTTTMSTTIKGERCACTEDWNGNERKRTRILAQIL